MQRFYKNLISAFGVGVIIYFGYLLYYYFMGQLNDDFTIQLALVYFYQCMIFTFFLYMLNAYWLQYVIKMYKNEIFSIKRFVVSVGGSVLVSLFGIFLTRIVINVVIGTTMLTDFLDNESMDYYYEALGLSMVISIVFYSIWYYKYRQENKVKEQKIIAGTASAKFDALKNQLDPHFLFNSLNVLSSLIEEDTEQAQKFTISLSKVYRYVLEQKNKDLVTVDNELQFAKTYIRLLKMRFEDSIVFEIPEQSKNPEAKIIPLALQLLLENAVKHNIVTAEKCLHIKVIEQADMLIVTNNLQEKQVVKKSSGVGLQNIVQRYALLTKRKVIIDKTSTTFSVSLPVLATQTEVVQTQDAFIEDKLYEKAKAHVALLKKFYTNLIAFCAVVPYLVYLNYNSGGFPWVFFVIFGWGFSLLKDGLDVFDYDFIWGKKWEERKLKKYMDEDDV